MDICTGSPLLVSLRSKTIRRVPAYYGLRMIHYRSQSIGLQPRLGQIRPAGSLTAYLHHKEWRHKVLPPPWLPERFNEPREHPQDTFHLVILILRSMVNFHHISYLLLVHSYVPSEMSCQAYR